MKKYIFGYTNDDLIYWLTAQSKDALFAKLDEMGFEKPYWVEEAFLAKSRRKTKKEN